MCLLVGLSREGTGVCTLDIIAVETISVVLCFGAKSWAVEATLGIHEHTAFRLPGIAFRLHEIVFSVSQYPICDNLTAKIRHGWNSPRVCRIAIIYSRTRSTIILVPIGKRAGHVNDKP